VPRFSQQEDDLPGLFADVDPICIYSDRSKIKHLGNLRWLFLRLEEPYQDLFRSAENLLSENTTKVLLPHNCSYSNAIQALLSHFILSFAVSSFTVSSTTECDHMLESANFWELCNEAFLLESLRQSLHEISRLFLHIYIPVILRVHVPPILQGCCNVVIAIFIVKNVLRFSSSAHCRHTV
jgi:hypothetical protein